MDNNELIEIYNKKMQDIDVNTAKRLLNASNRLIDYDIINRVLIDYQVGANEEEVRSEEEWKLLGREVVDTTKVIKLVEAEVVKEYYDVATGEAIKVYELSLAELKKALELGIIERRNKECNIKTILAYGISNTEKVRDGYKEFKTLGYKDITKALFSLYNVNTVLSDKSYFDEKNNTLYISKNEPREAINEICSVIVSNNKDKVKNNVALEYSVKTLLGLNGDLDEKDIDNIEYNEIYSIIRDVVSKSGKNRLEGIKGMKNLATKLERAIKTLAVMEAAYTRRLTN